LTKNFEYNFEKEQDSDLEQDDLEDEKILHDPLTDKNQMINRCKALQDKLKEKAEQIKLLQSNLEETKKRQKEILDTIAKEQTTEIKDKKLIELAKKNQDFKLQIEKFKLKEKEYEKKISELNTEIHNLNIINLTSDKNGNISNNNETEANTGNNIIDLKKKLKTSEAKIADIRNKLQLSKEENSKLNILIKREIGENIDFEKALKDKTYWKGRSEIIESLKTKIKILESQIFSAGLNNLNPNNSTNNLSIISEEGKNSNSNSTTNNAINLNFNLQRNSNSNNKSIISTVNNPSLYQEYKREKERLNTEVEKLKEENSKITIDYNRVKLRKEALEKEVKQQKEDLTSKIKILLEKSDNDEKLILALNRELEKKGKGLFTNPNDENSLFNMQQEILKLRNDIKEKENFINNINTLMMGEGNNYNSGNRDQQSNLQNFSRIIIRLKELEDENKRLKQKSDDGKIYESLAKENAKLRLKVKELEDKLCER